jgi:hypothetical protein
VYVENILLHGKAEICTWMQSTQEKKKHTSATFAELGAEDRKL